MTQRTMRERCTRAARAAAVLVAIAGGPSARAADIKVDSREYKLALDLEAIGNAGPSDAAASFWKDRLKPVIGERAEPGKHDKKAKLKLKAERQVRYFDAPGCPLRDAQFILRERRAGQEKPELTLKLRGGDPQRIADTDLSPRNKKDGETKLEEDIVPKSGAAGQVAGKLSKSTKQPVDRTPKALDEVEGLFPTLKAHLPASANHSAKLMSGNVVREVVFDGVKVKLAHHAMADFAFTLWYTGPALHYAELSFKVRDGANDTKVMNSALELFSDLRSGLGSAALAEGTTKSEVALPPQCAPLS